MAEPQKSSPQHGAGRYVTGSPLEEECDEIDVGTIQGWMRHSGRFLPRSPARGDIGRDAVARHSCAGRFAHVDNLKNDFNGTSKQNTDDGPFVGVGPKPFNVNEV